MAGQIVHIEIPADDTEQARAFWGGLLARVPELPGPERVPHGAARREPGRGDHEHGARQGGTRSYFDVDDIDAGIAKVRELGGEASEKMPVPSMGWFSTCTDPHGNEFGLWQNDESAPTPEM